MGLYAPKGNLTITNDIVPLGQEQRVLIVGKMEDSGSAIEKALYQNITVESASTLFGANSLLADSVREFRVVNNITAIDCFAVKSQPGGSSSTASATFSGAVSATPSNATYPINVSLVKKKSGTAQENKGNAHIQILATAGDTATIVATKIFDALQAVLTPASLVAVADNGAGDLSFVSTVDSAVCDTFLVDISGTELIPGLDVNVSVFDGGNASYSLTKEELESAIEGVKYKICWINNDIDVGIMQSILEDRKNISCNEDVGGIGVFGFISNFVNVQNQANLYASDVLAMISDQGTISSNPSFGTPSHILATNYMAVISLREESGAVITNIIQNNGSDVQIGGVQTLGIPYHNTVLNNIPYRFEKTIYSYANDFSNTEKIALQNSGVTCLQGDKSINKVVLGSTPTTNYPNTGIWLEDIEIELVLSSELFLLAETNLKQAGFTSGDIPEDNNGFLNTATVANFFLIDYFPLKRNQGLLDNSQVSIDLTARTLAVDFDNVTETLDISYTATTARKLRNFNINIRYTKAG